MHITPHQGAGRGTWFRMNEQTFGSRYVVKLDASVLFGEGGQSQYNGQIAGAVICQLDEVMNDASSKSPYQRNKIYTKIKQFVEPGSARWSGWRKTSRPSR